MEDVQNAVVKLEEINWDEYHLQSTAESPSIADDAPFDAEIQNNEVKLEEVGDWDENNSTLSS